MEGWSIVEEKNNHSITPALHFSLHSRRQPINLPRTVCLPRVPKPVVQPVGTALPKFDFVRLESKTTPVRRQWNLLVAEALSHLCHARIEHAARVNDFALARSPCAQLAPDRTRMKIGL